MNLKPTQLGAEPKKIIALAVLVAVAAYFYFSNSSPSSSPTPSPTPTGALATAALPPAQKTPIRPIVRTRSKQGGLNKAAREFRPSVKIKDPIDPHSVDPTLHLDRLAKLQDVKMEAGTRSLFEILIAPPIDPKTIKEPGPIKPVYVASNRPQKPLPPAPPAPPPPDPQAPKIALKFYGWVNREKAGPRRAFFLDGDEIVIAAEGEMIKKRYKVVRIGVNSALVEDTQFKANAQQQLPLETEMTSG
jgi:hypothetical protein